MHLLPFYCSLYALLSSHLSMFAHLVFSPLYDQQQPTKIQPATYSSGCMILVIGRLETDFTFNTFCFFSITFPIYWRGGGGGRGRSLLQCQPPSPLFPPPHPPPLFLPASMPYTIAVAQPPSLERRAIQIEVHVCVIQSSRAALRRSDEYHARTATRRGCYPK